METEIMTFVVEIKESKNEESSFRFNTTTIQAMLSGLSVVYTEVFAWAVNEHFALWVRGSNADVLIASFDHHQAHFKNAQLFKGDDAEQFFNDIVTGHCWNDCSMLRKLNSFNYGYELARSLDGLGPCLLPMLNEGKQTMSVSPFITGAQYSWNYANDTKNEDADFMTQPVQIKSKDLFYRLSIN